VLDLEVKGQPGTRFSIEVKAKDFEDEEYPVQDHYFKKASYQLVNGCLVITRDGDRMVFAPGMWVHFTVSRRGHWKDT